MTAVVLTIAGSDPIGGAGVQADIKTIHALGGYAISVVTAINAQNFDGVAAVYALPIDQVRSQLTALKKLKFDAVKIGQLANDEIIDCVAEFIEPLNVPVVLDPVLVSSSGRRLLDESAQPGLVHRLMPNVTLMTPNLPEVNSLLNGKFLGEQSDMAQIGHQFNQLGLRSILVKGGHTEGSSACDYLIHDQQIQPFCSPRIPGLVVKGTGCALSSAIATFLAQGASLDDAVSQAKRYLTHRLTQKHFVDFHQAWSLSIIDPFAD